LIREHEKTTTPYTGSFLHELQKTPRERNKQWLKTLKEEHLTNPEPGKDCLLREADIRKYRILKLQKKIQKERGTGSMDSQKQRKGFCFMPLVFQHMGFYGTYSSLEHGVLSLDPTLTKEVIDLCMQLPIDCYVHNGKERRMVRDYHHRGADADLTFSMWDDVKEGERLYIDPFVNYADFKINTYFTYERGVHVLDARMILSQVKEDSIYYKKACRILSSLEDEEPIDHSLVPMSSVLREFMKERYE